MPAHVIIEVEVTNPEVYEDYRHKLPPTMAKFGGAPIVRGFSELLDGQTDMDRISVIEFPDREAALAWFSSPEVEALNAQRRASAKVAVRLVG